MERHSVFLRIQSECGKIRTRKNPHVGTFHAVQNLKMAESSRSLSPNNKKVKRSKLAGAATTKTTFKSEWKKEFPFIASVPNDVRPVRDVTEKAHCINFL